MLKHLHDKEVFDEVLNRVDSLSAESIAMWGKMNVNQMMAHCSNALEMAMGTRPTKRLLIGKILGRFAKPIYANEKPFGKNGPTTNELRVVDQRDFFQEKEKLKTLLHAFCSGGVEGCTSNPHPFFGTLTPSEWSRGMYKHMDHHLRQFGC
jgi:hypothetical protein